MRTRPKTQLTVPRRIPCASAPGIFLALLVATIPALLPKLVRAQPAAPQATATSVLKMEIDREVEPVLATYIKEGLADAARRHASLILITMDTPGGLSDSMREIISQMLSSPVPVVVYVSPAGARGASAGFFILLAADVAAMAPGTHTGAASPLIGIGAFPVQIDETLRRKITNDAMAFLRSFAAQRGRNISLAETAVTDAKAFTEKEALDGKLIDLIAASPEELLRQLNGREIVRFDGTRTTLSLPQPVITPFELSARQRFLARIVQPDVFFVLLILGVLGLYAEFTHPGLIAPGVIGGICLVLALYAMHILPVNAAGVFLIFLALALFILEAKFASHGVLAVGGAVAMFLGAIFLIRSPLTGGGVSLTIALAVTLPFAILTVVLMRLVLRSRKWKLATGPEELLGLSGIVITPIPGDAAREPRQGMVRVRGELWRAVAPQPVGAGGSVRVIRVDGLTLHVEPAEPKKS
jgi:membrane-bound serine protease (ClpP class)